MSKNIGSISFDWLYMTLEVYIVRLCIKQKLPTSSKNSCTRICHSTLKLKNSCCTTVIIFRVNKIMLTKTN